jgi:hypothetical protein
VNDEQTPAEPRYDRLEAWVEEFLLDVVRRRIQFTAGRDGPALIWCHSWWDHPEALHRLEAAWRAWEYSRTDKAPVTEPANWWLSVLDPTMAALTGPGGVFWHCAQGHETTPRLVTDPVPAGWIADLS